MAYSQQLAGAGCSLQHDSSLIQKGQGENLWMGTGQGDIAIAAAKGWYEDELKHYEFPGEGEAYDRCGSSGKTGHLTQMIWEKSEKLGCGYAHCSGGGSIVTCRYSPPGNVQTQQLMTNKNFLNLCEYEPNEPWQSCDSSLQQQCDSLNRQGVNRNSTGGNSTGSSTGGPGTGSSTGGPGTGSSTGGPGTGNSTGGNSTGNTTGGKSSGNSTGGGNAVTSTPSGKASNATQPVDPYLQIQQCQHIEFNVMEAFNCLLQNITKNAQNSGDEEKKEEGKKATDCAYGTVMYISEQGESIDVTTFWKWVDNCIKSKGGRGFDDIPGDNETDVTENPENSAPNLHYTRSFMYVAMILLNVVLPVVIAPILFDTI